MLKVDKVLLAHQCHIPKDEHVTVRYIDSGFFVYFRRYFRKSLMVSKLHPGTKECFRSGWAIRREEARHLQHYYYVIHPFSRGVMYWQFFMCLVFLFSLFIVPVQFAADVSGWTYVKLTLDIFCCYNIVVTLFTGYYDRYKKQVVLDFKKIVFNYLTGYLVVDLISSLPMHFIATHVFGIGEQYMVLKHLELIKFFRLFTMFKYLNVFRDHMGYSIYKFMAFKMMLFFIIILLWFSSFVYVIAKHKPNSWMTKEGYRHKTLGEGLIRACFKATYMLLLVGYSDTPTKTTLYKLMQSFMLQFGFMLKVYVLAQVVQIICKYNNSTNKYEQRMRQINEYARYKGLPEWMKRKICRYFEFKYQGRYINENEVMGALPPHLRKEITFEESRHFLEKVEFFRGLPVSVFSKILPCLRVVIVLPNDIILRSGTIGDSMYFISFGTVAVYSSEGKELCHLKDGAYFGEIALFLEQKRSANVVAVDCCELLELTRRDFYEAIEPYPEYRQSMKAMAQGRIHHVERQETDMNVDSIHVG